MSDVAVAEALGCWSPDDVARLVADRWAPRLLLRFSQAVRGLVARAPDPARRAALVSAARAVLAASPAARLALCRDPALARWTAAAEDPALAASACGRLCDLASRFALTVALLDRADASLALTPGPRGRIRIPADGRLLEGPPGRPLTVVVRGGALVNEARPARRAGPFVVVAGDEDEGRMPRFQPLAGRAAEDAVAGIAPGVEILAASAPATLAEASALAPALLPIAAEPGVSRSASIPDVRGAIWLSPCDRPLVLAETLVHEASHLKYYLAEDAHPFAISPDAPRYDVPWRPDPRPIRTVLMGLHAWVRVMDWLATLDGSPWSQPARERLLVLREGTHAAGRIVAAADGLTDAGHALGRALLDR